MTISASFFDNLYRKLSTRKNSLKKFVLYNIHRKMRWFKWRLQRQSKIQSKHWLWIKTGSRWGLNEIDLTIPQQLIYISIKSDVNSIWTEARKFNCRWIFGSNWREGLENEDGWDWVIKLNWIPEAQDDFYKLDNSRDVFMLKSHLSS